MNPTVHLLKSSIIKQSIQKPGAPTWNLSPLPMLNTPVERDISMGFTNNWNPSNGIQWLCFRWGIHGFWPMGCWFSEISLKGHIKTYISLCYVASGYGSHLSRYICIHLHIHTYTYSIIFPLLVQPPHLDIVAWEPHNMPWTKYCKHPSNIPTCLHYIPIWIPSGNLT